MNTLEKLNPPLVWKHFSNLCKIPRTSKHERAVIEYIQTVANSLGLKSKIDNVGNIIVEKSDTNGRSDSGGTILQAHVDMVPQKNDGIPHDFLNDPIIPYIDGDWVKAQNTTLGADNGIGVATILAIFESTDIKHGPIEGLFTIDEETGMTGALGLQPGILKGTKLLNLDTEEFGQLYIGCAGGTDCVSKISYTEDNPGLPCKAFDISIRGLKGGHSGIDIHLGRGNAIKLLCRLLFEGTRRFNLQINHFSGGSVRNAIPREAFATITVPYDKADLFVAFISEQQAIMNSELHGAEHALQINFSEAKVPSKVLSRESQIDFLRTIYSCPNGVIRMSCKVPGVVETSNNLGIASYRNGEAEIHCLLRSLISSARHDLENQVYSALSLGDAHVEFLGGYPGWEPDPKSTLLYTLEEIYKSMYGVMPEVKVVHAGLECGIIGSKYKNMEMVSLGPTIQFPHSPDEKVEISSVEKFWNYLIKILETI